jgi:hypothetical protein
MKQNVLVTESQCRELLKLKIYNGLSEDKQASDKKRLEIVKKIYEKDGRAGTTSIVEEVEKAMGLEKTKYAENKPIEKYSSELKSSVNSIQTKLNNILSSKKWTASETKEIKDTAIKQIEELLKELKEA